MAAAKTKSKSTGTGGRDAGSQVHDDFYRDLRAKITTWAKSKQIDAAYRDYILLVPDMFHLLTRLVMEPVVAFKEKAKLGVAVAYVLLPIDFIPDALFPIGLLDDLIVMVIVLDSVLNNVPKRLITKHWAGSADLFEAVRDTLAKADSWIGKGMFRRLQSYLKKQGIWKEAEAPATPPPVPKAAKKTATKTKAAKKTPSRRPAAKKTAKKKTARKTAAKKTTKKVAKKRTIAKKKGSKKGPSSS